MLNWRTGRTGTRSDGLGDTDALSVLRQASGSTFARFSLSNASRVVRTVTMQGYYLLAGAAVELRRDVEGVEGYAPLGTIA